MSEVTTVVTVGYKDFLDAGLPPRQVDYWTRHHWLRAIDPAPGSGNPRRWPEAELAVAVTMQRLRRAGLDIEVAHRVARGQPEIAPGVRVLIDNEGTTR